MPANILPQEIYYHHHDPTPTRSMWSLWPMESRLSDPASKAYLGTCLGYSCLWLSQVGFSQKQTLRWHLVCLMLMKVCIWSKQLQKEGRGSMMKPLEKSGCSQAERPPVRSFRAAEAIKSWAWGLPGGLVVKTLPSKARGVGSIPGRGAKVPHSSWPKNNT